MQLDKIFIYPIKSGAAVSIPDGEVEARGLRHDRRWMLVDADHRFITGRQYAQITQVSPMLVDDGIELRAQGMSPLRVERPVDEAETVMAQVWKDSVRALVADQEANRWLSDFLGLPLKLVYQGGDSHRPISGTGSQPGDEVSFADGYPLLALGTASLGDLNSRLETAVPVEQFRPNLVIRTDSPFVEDCWVSTDINGVRFDNAKLCTRCIFTTVDPRTGIKAGNAEPFKTLRSYRFDRSLKGVVFGVNWIARSGGKITVGDPVTLSGNS